MNFIKPFAVALTFTLMTGCAHNIMVSPDINKISPRAGVAPINKNVGFYISPEKKALRVTTAGGGGDKVSYLPYNDMETAFYKMLTNTFKGVTVLKSENDADSIRAKDIKLVLVPSVTTTSSSSSPFTWPPTNFMVNLTCDISDGNGKQVVSKSVTGQGNADFSEFKSDFALSGKRAFEDALLKMQDALLNAPELK